MLEIRCPKKDCGKSNWKFMGYKEGVEGEERVQRFYCKECHREFKDYEILDQFEGATQQISTVYRGYRDVEALPSGANAILFGFNF